jgi:hypothetical protein
MLNTIEQWIDQTNQNYSDQRVSCSCFSDKFSSFYSPQFLQESYYVVTDNIPKPDLPNLREMGLGDFIDMPVDGITYKNTYYVVPRVAEDLRLHFHELVHVAQWQHLGATSFIDRYIQEIQTYGYDGAPLEIMAYGLDAHYYGGGENVDVSRYVATNL